MKPKVLITLDEARAAVAASALELVRNWSLDHERLLASIRGDARVVLPQREAQRVSAHLRLIRALRRDGLGWLVEEELDGVCSYAGPICDEAWEDWVSPLASGE